MKILVDCDAMPRPLKEVLCTVAEREKIEIIFVAARAPRLMASKYIHAVGAGNVFNGADDWIADNIESGCLVITADIPLADRAIEKGAEVLNTKGEFFTPANIKNAMAMRELMDELRVSGEITGGPAPFSGHQRVNFINALNRWMKKR
ncbi:MAG: YaiI/YqxD family protein [Victivallaceae bacterium]|nr:YaiI/YqxD family protein [Victivallaceae bacterium]